MNGERGREEPDDRDLVAALRAQASEATFRQLYRRHTPRLYALVLRLLGGDRRHAEDAVQETWIRAVEGLDRFRGEAAFGTWLCSIGVHVARDVLRRERRLERLDEPFDAALPEPPIGDRIDLERAIAQLPDGYRTVWVLHDLEGHAHESIATLLGISVGTSKSQLHRARRALRAWLAPAAEEWS